MRRRECRAATCSAMQLLTTPASNQGSNHDRKAAGRGASQLQAVLVVHKVDPGPGDALGRILLLLPLRAVVRVCVHACMRL